nr:hypothetical protein [Tanacetum cinerariifolium]
MLVIMPFDNLKLCYGNDSVPGVDITSRFPIDCISIELFTFSSLPLSSSLKLHKFGLRHHPLDTQVNRESARDVYSRHRIIAITKLKIIEWHNYKHLDKITVRRNDDKLYTFKEGDYKRLHLQDIEDMLLLLVQGKLTNLTTEERLAVNVSF